MDINNIRHTPRVLDSKTPIPNEAELVVDLARKAWEWLKKLEGPKTPKNDYDYGRLKR